MAQGKNMLTLSTDLDLEHRSITDTAAVLEQATEAGAPIRSLGQMAVVNAQAQTLDGISSKAQRQLCRPLTCPFMNVTTSRDVGTLV